MIRAKTQFLYLLIRLFLKEKGLDKNRPGLLPSSISSNMRPECVSVPAPWCRPGACAWSPATMRYVWHKRDCCRIAVCLLVEDRWFRSGLDAFAFKLSGGPSPVFLSLRHWLILNSKASSVSSFTAFPTLSQVLFSSRESTVLIIYEQKHKTTGGLSVVFLLCWGNNALCPCILKRTNVDEQFKGEIFDSAGALVMT